MSIPEGWRNKHTDGVTNPKYRKLVNCLDCGCLVTNYNAIRCSQCAFEDKKKRSLAAALAKKDRERARAIEKRSKAIANVLGCDVTDAIRKLSAMVTFNGRNPNGASND